MDQAGALFDEPSGAAASALCACFASASASKGAAGLLAAIGEEKVASGQDPWAALLAAVEFPPGAVDAATAAAAEVVAQQLRALDAAPIPDKAPGDRAGASAWHMADAVRAMERNVLNEAAAALEGGLGALR